mmetsp:Transcript_95896/g.310896  ORF Transcript_95896/g.310896 Transcript_95896/m.310896 type:complete len:214 (+) Transcript_95896:1869-2510(+)
MPPSSSAACALAATYKSWPGADPPPPCGRRSMPVSPPSTRAERRRHCRSGATPRRRSWPGADRRPQRLAADCAPPRSAEEWSPHCLQKTGPSRRRSALSRVRMHFRRATVGALLLLLLTPPPPPIPPPRSLPPHPPQLPTGHRPPRPRWLPPQLRGQQAQAHCWRGHRVSLARDRSGRRCCWAVWWLWRSLCGRMDLQCWGPRVSPRNTPASP